MTPSDGEAALATVFVPSTHRAAAETPISAVLSHGGVHVGLDADIAGLAEVLLQQRATAAAVTNDFGAVVGLISTAELVAIAHQRALEGSTAQDLMRGPASLLPETASLATAAAVMAMEGATELPIACSACESICMLSARDILGWLSGPDERPGL